MTERTLHASGHVAALGTARATFGPLDAKNRQFRYP